MAKWELIDSGEGRKLERYGDHLISRPCSQAVWKPQTKLWKSAKATFARTEGNRWEGRHSLPETWVVEVAGLKFKISPTDFGHLGVFPEHQEAWGWMSEKIGSAGRDISFLNLFAYSGGATLAAAKAGAKVCHLDASKGMVSWARENAALNGLEAAPVRWIVDDVTTFLEREIRRGRHYDAILLDPPTYGRGSKGEVFKIEQDLPQLLSLCGKLLSKQPLFLFLSCHTPGFTPLVLQHLIEDAVGSRGKFHGGELLLPGDRPVPSGCYARWESD